MAEYKSKVDIIYDVLIDGITNGTYKQGDRLVISKIAKQNSISEIPVREAIRRLESMGYAKIHANQGAVISGFDSRKIVEVFQIKGVLEGYAARLSIDYLSPKDFDELRDKNNQMKEAFELNDIREYSDLNVQFHLGIYKKIPQRELYNMIVDLWRKWRITKSVFELSPQRPQKSFEEHEEIIKLLEKKQYEAVEQYVRKHKNRSGLEFIKFCEEEKNENLRAYKNFCVNSIKDTLS